MIVLGGIAMKKIIPLLLLCLLLAACQNSPAPADTGTQPKQSTAATTMPTTVPPASTAAPTEPPASTAAPKNTAENAEKVTVGMTLAQVQDLLGEDCMDVGSGAIIYQWELTNGQYALVHFSRHSGSDELFVTSITLTDSPFN